jgi:hypothetical protein
MPLKFAFAACLLVFAASVWGGLGKDGPCLEAVHQRQLPMLTASGVRFTRVQLELESGTVVRVFRDRSGAVFAVSWSGPFLPDMRELLGPHFAALSDQQRRPGPGGNLVVRHGSVVVVSEGRLGAFHGRAWLPGQLPAGFNPGALQ